MPGEQADEVLRSLLADPHPAVGAALAWWTAPGARSDPIRHRLARLPREVTVGDLPSQAEADLWASEHTLGLIDRFPTRLRPEMLLVLASALATKVSWSSPFGLASADELGGESPWAASLNVVLRSRSDHRVGLFSSPIGILGVHVASAHEGLDVHSVIGPPDVPATEVIAAWLGGATATCDVSELDLGDGHAWSLTEAEGYGATAVSSAVLPAWSSSSEFDLMDHTLGFGTAMALLDEDLPKPAPLVEARQVALAEYTRTGFQAAAVTIEVVASAALRPCLQRRLTVRFNRPFAVFATAVHRRGTRTGPLSPWHGLPAFSGWITTPTDATGT